MALSIFDLNGKIAMVTGSTRGMGEVSAMALAKAGADVAICGRNQEDLFRVSSAIRELGRNSDGFSFDVTSKKSVQEGVAQVLEQLGRVDILVNNAGLNHRVAVLEFEEEEWDRIITTNLRVTF